MMKIPSKGYLAPWSSGRETAGLMGAFLLFLFGASGHSELFMVISAMTLVRQLIQLMLVFLGLSTPQTQAPVVIATPLVARVQPVRVLKKLAPVVKVGLKSMFLRTDPTLRRFTYQFEGKATFHHQPCPN